MRVRDQDILLPTTMVGSFPRPEWLHGKIFGEYDEPDYINDRIKQRYEDAVRKIEALVEGTRIARDRLSGGGTR